MSNNLKKIEKTFNSFNTDKERWEYLFINQHSYFPEWTVLVDNDDIFVTFKCEDGNEDDRTVLTFDEHGYKALVEVLRAIKIEADLV